MHNGCTAAAMALFGSVDALVVALWAAFLIGDSRSVLRQFRGVRVRSTVALLFLGRNVKAHPESKLKF